MAETLNFLLEQYEFIILYPIGLYVLLTMSLVLVFLFSNDPSDGSLSREFKTKFTLHFGWPALTALIAAIMMGWISVSGTPLSRINVVPMVFLVVYFVIGSTSSAVVLTKLKGEYK